jgi:hypothetical protein
LETKEWLVGFYLVEAQSEAMALTYAKRIATESHRIEVRPAPWHRIG